MVEPRELILVQDSRRGAFYADGKKYDATLVDLPTIIESQKTLDKKQFFKVADISQVKEACVPCIMCGGRLTLATDAPY